MTAESTVDPEPTGVEPAAQPADDQAPVGRWRISIALIVVASIIAILTAVDTWVAD